ncbi:MAG: response regulator [Alphaproteobacteria bacterium]
MLDKDLRVLLVDDSPPIRFVMPMRLGQCLGIPKDAVKIHFALSGQEALGLMKTNAYDLILTDTQMPKMDGAGLIHAIRSDEQWQHIPVILISGNQLSDRGMAETLKKLAGLKVTFDAFCWKNNLVNGLKPAIEQAFASRTAVLQQQAPMAEPEGLQTLSL